ncbi:MAG: protein O-GlcNAcase [Trueperaceae bacterium]
MSRSPFPVRGVIEGFYGLFYTHPERLSLLDFMGRHGYNLYIYGPKNDRQHRNRWREPYPARLLEQFGEAVGLSREMGIDFCYALSPGIDICYSSEEEFEHVSGKFLQFYKLGVRDFSLLLDDIRRTFPNQRDADSYSSFAQAQADLCNRVYAWLQKLDPKCRLSMCPTDYHGAPPFSPALHELGSALHPHIDVFYTGTQVCSAAVDRAEVEVFAATLKRRPILWDNYPVNDLAMDGELHIGPVRGRAEDLAEAMRGAIVNPMNQAEASKIVLATYADYLEDPGSYSPETSWEPALSEVAGEHRKELRMVAENSLHCCLGTPEAKRLGELSDAAIAAMEAEVTDDPAIDELVSYLEELDEACYALRYRMENLELRNELAPWLEQLERWTWLGRWSVETLRAQRSTERVDTRLLRRIEEYVDLVARHPKRMGGTHLLPLATLALERCRQQEAA